MKRIQRKRTKGWKMPSNTVYVGRPTKWGNPFEMRNPTNRIPVIMAYEDWLKRKLKEVPTFLDELKGKNLACWCPLDKPCHADILIAFLKQKEKLKELLKLPIAPRATDYAGRPKKLEKGDPLDKLQCPYCSDWFLRIDYWDHRLCCPKRRR